MWGSNITGKARKIFLVDYAVTCVGRSAALKSCELSFDNICLSKLSSVPKNCYPKKFFIHQFFPKRSGTMVFNLTNFFNLCWNRSRPAKVIRRSHIIGLLSWKLSHPATRDPGTRPCNSHCNISIWKLSQTIAAFFFLTTIYHFLLMSAYDLFFTQRVVYRIKRKLDQWPFVMLHISRSFNTFSPGEKLFYRYIK